LWVIDHQTTTAQAASHTGGRYNKGGDLLYRWGNPQTYDPAQMRPSAMAGLNSTTGKRVLAAGTSPPVPDLVCLGRRRAPTSTPESSRSSA
jgi:hypothetical protein